MHKYFPTIFVENTPVCQEDQSRVQRIVLRIQNTAMVHVKLLSLFLFNIRWRHQEVKADGCSLRVRICSKESNSVARGSSLSILIWCLENSRSRYVTFLKKLMRLAQIHQFAVDGCIQSCPVWPKSHGEWRVPDWESSQLGFSLMYELYLNCRHVENFTEWVATELMTRFLSLVNPTGVTKKALSSFSSPYFIDQI